MNLPPVSLLLASVMSASVAQLALKLGTAQLSMEGSVLATAIKAASNGWVLLGAFLYALSFVLWIPGLKRVDLSFAYPFIALGIVLVSILSWLVLNESLSPARLAGIGLIIAGLLTVAAT
jgi:multidrug transporter EmrE-like cation transporter